VPLSTPDVNINQYCAAVIHTTEIISTEPRSAPLFLRKGSNAPIVSLAFRRLRDEIAIAC
jgi:hypothetical protein